MILLFFFIIFSFSIMNYIIDDISNHHVWDSTSKKDEWETWEVFTDNLYQRLNAHAGSLAQLEENHVERHASLFDQVFTTSQERNSQTGKKSSKKLLFDSLLMKISEKL